MRSCHLRDTAGFRASHNQNNINSGRQDGLVSGFLCVSWGRAYTDDAMLDSAQSNQLSLPFRRATQLSLSTAIRQYISKKYDQHPDMFRHDLEVIDTLRRDAVNVREAHPSGINKLQAYAAQLQFIGSKFPIDVTNPAGYSQRIAG